MAQTCMDPVVVFVEFIFAPPPEWWSPQFDAVVAAATVTGDSGAVAVVTIADEYDFLYGCVDIVDIGDVLDELKISLSIDTLIPAKDVELLAGDNSQDSTTLR